MYPDLATRRGWGDEPRHPGQLQHGLACPRDPPPRVGQAGHPRRQLPLLPGRPRGRRPRWTGHRRHRTPRRQHNRECPWPRTKGPTLRPPMYSWARPPLPPVFQAPGISPPPTHFSGTHFSRGSCHMRFYTCHRKHSHLFQLSTYATPLIPQLSLSRTPATRIRGTHLHVVGGAYGFQFLSFGRFTFSLFTAFHTW